jgi:hypothetical protein
MEVLINVLELASELAERDLIIEYGGKTAIFKHSVDGVTTYTDEMQDKFNDLYDDYYEFIVGMGHADKSNHQNSYGVFCMAMQLEQHMKELDFWWDRAIFIYHAFLVSKFNNAEKSELDCIKEYVSDLKID